MCSLSSGGYWMADFVEMRNAVNRALGLPEEPDPLHIPQLPKHNFPTRLVTWKKVKKTSVRSLRI